MPGIDNEFDEDAWMLITVAERAARMITNNNVAARIEELRAQNAEKCQMSREAAIAWLERAITTGVGSITPEDELCQSYSVGKHRTKIAMPDKIVAMRQLASMTGWLGPEKVQVGADPELVELMRRIRAG